MLTCRVKNTKRNIFANLVNRLVSIILPFINRTLLLWYLGTEITGVVGLFTSILHVLSIAELGFNTVVVYSLYKPIADRNNKEICKIVSLLKRVYYIVGTTILISGICILPFLTYLIKGEPPNEINIYFVFILYLINSSTSYYLFAYKECMLIADQRQDISTNIRTSIDLLRYIVQFVILLTIRSLYLYLIIAIIGTIITNICIYKVTKDRYPFFHDVPITGRLPDGFMERIKGIVINKICDICRNSFDSIIISTFMGLTITAIYNNYYFIYNSIYGIMLVICNSMSASVGNVILKKSIKDNFDDLQKFSLIFTWIAGFCTISLACLYQPFMQVWVGNSLMFSEYNMILMCIYFYIINLNNIRNQYINGSGIWWKLRKSYLIEAIANLVLNIVLGKYYGISGIIWATIITIFCFNYILRNKILFENYFINIDIYDFYKEQIYYAIIVFFTGIFVYNICNLLPFYGIYVFIIRAFLCLFTINAFFYIGYSRCKIFDDAKAFMLRFVQMKI